VAVAIPVSVAIPAGSFWRRGGFLCTPTHASLLVQLRQQHGAVQCMLLLDRILTRVSIALVYAHKIRIMSVEEKFREYKLVPDVLRVPPSEKAEVSLLWTQFHAH